MKETYLLVWGALALALGIWLGGMAALPLLPLGAGGAFCVAAALLALYRDRRLLGWGLGLLALALAGMVRMGLAGMEADQEAAPMDGAAGQFYGVIAEEAMETDVWTRYTAALSRVRYADGEERPAKGTVYLYVPQEAGQAPFLPDMAVIIRGRVSPVRLYQNPGKIDLESRYRSRRLIGRIYTEEPGDVTAAGPAGQYRMARWASEVKEMLRERFRPYVDGGRLPLLMTLLFGGSYHELPDGVLDSFTRTGLIHILSVSGSHMALLMGAVCLLGRWCGLSRRWVLPLGAGAILSYAALAGFVPPVVRASIMGILSAAGLFLRRDREALCALGAAAAGMLLWEPYYLFDVSFQLSVGASAGILLFYPPFLAGLARIPHLPRRAAEAASLALSAQVLTMPVVLYDFHQLPVYFLPANLFVAPLLDGTILLGLAAAIFSFFLTPLSGGLLQAADYALVAAIRLNGWLSGLPHAVLPLGAMAAGSALLYYTGAALFLGRACLRGRQRLAGTVWVLACAAWQGWCIWRLPEAVCLVPDLGYARAAVLQCGGRTVLYYRDSGLPIDMGSRELRSVLGYRGIFAADVLIADFRKSRGAAPFTLDIPIRELWVMKAGAPGAAALAASHPESRVRIVNQAAFVLDGGLSAVTDGVSWELRFGEAALYLDGGTLLSDLPPARRIWIGGAEPFHSAVNGSTIDVLHPEAAVYAGSRMPAAGEDFDYFQLAGIPAADTYRSGMASLAFRRGDWTMETFLRDG